MARVLVIGANGFIGSHVVDELSRAGHEVTAFDRFGSRTHSFTAQNVRVVAGEFMNSADLATAVRGQQYVFHLLSTTNPASTHSEPSLDIRTNLLQTVTLLELCVAAGIEHFYFASTGGAIYGPQGRSSYSETDQTLPISPYAIGKLAIERYLEYFRITHGLDTTAFRISNPYGTRQHPLKKQGMIPISLRRVLSGQPVQRMGDGEMVRDYLYVDDLASIIAGFAGRPSRHRLYNIGSGTGLSVNDVLATMREVTATDFAVETIETPSTFVPHVILNIARLTEEFGAPTFTDLRSGMRATYDEMAREAS